MAPSRSSHPNRKSLVLAEENADVRRDYAPALREAGFAGMDVCSDEALRAVHEQHPDVVITDLMRSDMDGVELTRELRSNPATRHIPVIGVSCRPTVDRYRVGRAGFAQVGCELVGLVADAGVMSHRRPASPGHRLEPFFVRAGGCEVIGTSLDSKAGWRRMLGNWRPRSRL